MFISDRYVPDNPGGTVVIQNMKPKWWDGQTFNIGIYKNRHLMLMQKDVAVGDQVDFVLQPKLFFAVAKDMYLGKIFQSVELSTTPVEFNLTQFPNGMFITLFYDKDTTEYTFEAEEMTF